MDNLLLNSLVGERFIVKEFIAPGNYGTLFKCYDTKNCNFVALKVEKYDEKLITFRKREAQILCALNQVKGTPSFIWFGNDKKFTYLVTQHLGPSLSDSLKEKKKFSIYDICDIAIQMIEILREVHSKFVIHRDIKPDNIVFGINNEKNDLYLKDFEISMFHNCQHKNNNQLSVKIPMQSDRPFIGTQLYASIASHLGQEQGKKDDLECLGYVLIFLLKGKLPWQNIQYEMNGGNKQEQIGILKQNIEQLCKDLPNQFIRYFQYCKMLQFDVDPNYFLLKTLFFQIQQDIRKEFQFKSDSLIKDEEKIQIYQQPENKINRQQPNLISPLISQKNYDPKVKVQQKQNFTRTLSQNNNIISQQEIDKFLNFYQIFRINKIKLEYYRIYLSQRNSFDSEEQDLKLIQQKNYSFLNSQLSQKEITLKMLQLKPNDDMDEHNDLQTKMSLICSTKTQVFVYFIFQSFQIIFTVNFLDYYLMIKKIC